MDSGKSKSFSFPGGRRHAALGPALRERFGCRVMRIPLDAGFTCPTRDGTLATGGCLYCDAGGARAARVDPTLPIGQQLARGISNAIDKRLAQKFIAYFQAFTNTYAPVETLRKTYEEGLGDPRVVAMAVGTRPDCLDSPARDLLREFNERTFLWLEVGLQSANDETLRTVRRCHSVAQWEEAVGHLRRLDIRFCAHVIFGLPGDSPDDMLRAAELLNETGAWGVKIHNLYIDRESPMAELYRKGEIGLLSREEYMDLAIEFLARLSPSILIHRLVGEAPPDRLLAPDWAGDKQGFLKDLDSRMASLDVWQGRKCGS
ncbi:TIGR01212 family radical SAM protein [Candidatus Sumerlaeota bacterium]|nr:TIGR01212 family radical SAM protein [Candidatus Sumerlaeota bacterium]